MIRRFRVLFVRIGRAVSPIPLEVEVDETGSLEVADEIAKAIYYHIKQRKMIHSPWFTVLVNLSEMKGLIEEGRFGSFTLEEIT